MTSIGVLVAATARIALARNVYCPALSIVRFGKVTTPPTGLRLCVPDSDAPPGLLLNAIVTVPVKSVTGWPAESTTATCTGPIAWPAVAWLGRVTNVNRTVGALSADEPPPPEPLIRASSLVERGHTCVTEEASSGCHSCVGTGIAGIAGMSPLPLAGVAYLQVLDHIALKAWDRVLFVECGDGWIAEEAWRRAGRAYVYGLDMSQDDVALAKRIREVPGKVEFETWDGRTLPVPDHSFDRAVAIVVGPRVAAAALVRDLSRVLRGEGSAYLLHSAATDADIHRELARAAWREVREVARCGDETALLRATRCATPERR